MSKSSYNIICVLSCMAFLVVVNVNRIRTPRSLHLCTSGLYGNILPITLRTPEMEISAAPLTGWIWAINQASLRTSFYNGQRRRRCLFRDGVGNVWEMVMEKSFSVGQVSQWASVSFHQDALQTLIDLNFTSLESKEINVLIICSPAETYVKRSRPKNSQVSGTDAIVDQTWHRHPRPTQTLSRERLPVVAASKSFVNVNRTYWDFLVSERN